MVAVPLLSEFAFLCFINHIPVYTAEGYSVELIQIVDYSKMQTGKAYKKGSSDYPAPEGYEEMTVAESKEDQTVADDRFQVFYDSYPRKYRKPEAEKVWKIINPDDDEYRMIMNGLSNWIPYYATIDPKYIPIAATFLKNKIYQDFPPKENKRAVNDIKNQTYEDLREWVYGSDCSNNNDYVDQFCGKDSENDVIYE